MKKRFRPLLILLLSLCMAALFTALSPAQAELFGIRSTVLQAAETKVTSTALNLRLGPGTSYSTILTMPEGAALTVLSTSASWSKVTYQGTTGYAYKEYLVAPAGKTYLAINSVNLRSGPGTGFSILTKISSGSFVQVYSVSEGWASVSLNGRSGYAYSSNLSQGKKYVTTDTLNLRTGPGLGYTIIGTLPQGATVRVYRIASNWGWVGYQGKLGYSRMDFLRLPGSSEPSPGSAKVIRKGVTTSSGKRIAITFDDGGSLSNVNKVLDILDDYNAKSTFFYTGEWISAHPKTSRRIVARGHRMESHSVSHPFLTQLSDAQVRYQLNRSREIIEDTVGTTPRLLRPPYGDTSSRILRLAGEAGYRYMVMWSMDTNDYKSSTTASDIVRRAVAGASNNSILLLHTTHGKVVDALPRILSQLEDKGYDFVTVNSMLP